MLFVKPWAKAEKEGQFYESLDNPCEEDILATGLDQRQEKHMKLEFGHRTRPWPLFYTVAGLSVMTFVLVAISILAFRPEEIGAKVSLVPDLPLERVTFKIYPEYTAPASPESDALWMSLLGPGMGFIGIPNPQDYGLKGGIQTENGTQNFGVSMFHSLHCLAIIRSSFWQLHNDHQRQSQSEDNADNKPVDTKHTNHCFDYLRQELMCTGDMTIEGAKSEGSHDINGMNVEHANCKSFEVARMFMDARAPGKLAVGEEKVEI